MPGLADGLRRNRADRLAHRNRLAAGKVRPVAVRANADRCLTRQDVADFDRLNACGHDLCNVCFVHHLIRLDEHLARGRVDNVLARIAAQQTVLKRLDDLVAVLDRRNDDALFRAAVLFMNDDLLADVDQTAGQITRVRRTQRRVGEALSRAVRRDEVLEHV